MPKSVLWSASLGCLAAFALVRPTHRGAPAQVSLDLTTLHAAALSTARDAADSSDAPYLLVSVIGSAGKSQSQELPATGHWALHADQAVGRTPITTLTLQPGDSIRILLSVLEDRAASAEELKVATAATTTLAAQRSFTNPASALVTPAFAPLTTEGAHWLGSASLLLTNTGGKVYWSSLECVATCKVLRGPAAAGAELTAPQAESGVVELDGADATYHMQVAVSRMP
jgi:hypothetical protein